MNTIKYISYYDTLENADEKRSYVLAAKNKIDYICSALTANGYSVEIISASGTEGKKTCRTKRIHISDSISLKLFHSLGRGGRLKNFISYQIKKIHMFLYLLLHLKKGEKVIVYHSLGYMNMVRLLKKLKDFQLVLEVEEIYSDVSGKQNIREKELAFFKIADAYLFPTELLNSLVNTESKPYGINYGTYKVEPDRNVSFDDGKIHLLYAGTFDPKKGGAMAAIGAAAALDSDYHLHILGFGNEKDKKATFDAIEKANAAGGASVTYDGLLSGEDYIRFLQKCDIGFSTQTPDADFNDTSFPSKVLSYLANGLRVVSVKINVLELSAVNDLLYYYEENTPEAIAEAVKKVDIQTPYDSRRVIEKLDRQFISDLKEVLKSL